eukprot:COSAG04_NODE_11230_length_722_cov_0.813804_2_plen_37_part_01
MQKSHSLCIEDSASYQLRRLRRSTYIPYLPFELPLRA